ncbi:MAG TPA: hypothetical protein VEL31_07880 [Ktedonobacteraceae bacterium]|nr:hypothetical protein [Ktedonobacteraceae bacterium]
MQESDTLTTGKRHGNGTLARQRAGTRHANGKRKAGLQPCHTRTTDPPITAARRAAPLPHSPMIVAALAVG